MALPRFLLRPTCLAILKHARALFAVVDSSKSTSSLARASTTSWATSTPSWCASVLSLLRGRSPPELNRTRENLAISAEFGVHYARMEVEGQLHTGWQVNLRNAYCPCRYQMKMGYCCHLLFGQQSRSVVDESGEEILVNRKRVQNTGWPQSIGHALQRL
ncbi:hypothetical protein PI124_g13843 [Phytophthora idaei]|nr:hypothetical protein PI125_g12251 [Phytophthora idaei]KAG3241283.1 hypothetical protein PI124_g13843 [Phytophthora idaei]